MSNKEKYLELAKSLDALGNTTLADACRAKAASFSDPKPENPWVRGTHGYVYRVSRDGDVVECSTYVDESDSWPLGITGDTLRALAQQIGMIDPKDLKWGAVGTDNGSDKWSIGFDVRKAAEQAGRRWGYGHVFQYLPTERIR